MEVVDQARVEANVGVDDERDGEQTVEDWLGLAGTMSKTVCKLSCVVRGARLTYALPELTAAPPMIGMRPAESSRSNVQWYDPCDLCDSNVGAASLTVPCRTAVETEQIERHDSAEERRE